MEYDDQDIKLNKTEILNFYLENFKMRNSLSI